MISESCDFKEFIKAIKSKGHMEILYLTEQEATGAERLALRSRSNPKESQKCDKNYPVILKDFIQYLKYTVKFKLPDDQDYQLFLTRNEDTNF